jgi:hypothetical protein
MSLIILTHNYTIISTNTKTNPSTSNDGNDGSGFDTINCELSIVNELYNDNSLQHPYHYDHHYITFYNDNSNSNSMVFIQLSECDHDRSSCYHQLNISNCLSSSSLLSSSSSSVASLSSVVVVSPSTLNVVTYPCSDSTINCYK